MPGPAHPVRGGRHARAAVASSRAVLALGLAMLVLGAVARADDLEDAVPLQKALDASRQVLLLVPQAVHQDCIDALREVSSTKESLEFNARSRGTYNFAVARDVLAADYDSAARSCGEDASRACASAGKTAALALACGKMLPLPPP